MLLLGTTRPPIGGPTTTASQLTLAVLIAALAVDRLVGGGTPVRTTSTDRGSYWLLQLGQLAAIGGGLAAPFIAPWADLPDWVWIAGIVVMVAGAALRVWAVRSLGEHFRRDVDVVDDQPLVTTGPYRWLRHPSYTGILLLLAGLGLAQANWVSLLLLTVVPFAVYSYRIRIEEAALEEQLGDDYRVFAATRARLIPRLY